MFLYPTLIWQSGYPGDCWPWNYQWITNWEKSISHIWTRKRPRFTGKLKETFFSGAGCIKQLSLWQVVSWKAIRGVWQPPPHIKFFQPVNCTVHSAKLHSTQCKTAQYRVQNCTVHGAKVTVHNLQSKTPVAHVKIQKTYHTMCTVYTVQYMSYSARRAHLRVHNARFVSAQPQSSAAFSKGSALLTNWHCLHCMLALCTVNSAQYIVPS